MSNDNPGAAIATAIDAEWAHAHKRLLKLAEGHAGDFDPPVVCWVVENGVDSHDDYCPDCIDVALADASVSGLWCDDPDEEFWERPRQMRDEAPYSDDCRLCSRCGCLLGYLLTSYGAAEEIDHFLMNGVQPGEQIAYELARAIEAADGEDNLTIEEIATLRASLVGQHAAVMRCEVADAGTHAPGGVRAE